MGLWETLNGGPPKTATSSSTYANPPQTQDTFQSAPFDPTTAQDVSSFLNPSTSFDPSSLHPLAGLNQESLDYLALEDTTLDMSGGSGALPSRGWSDDLCYGTGTTYLAALTVGGAWGLAEGLNRTPASAPPKLRLNAVLNAVTRRGPFLGNSAAVIAMVYNGFNSTIGYYRGKHDAANSVVAGALSGMLFKSTKGIRPMAISGAMVATAAGAWAVRHSTRRHMSNANIDCSLLAKHCSNTSRTHNVFCSAYFGEGVPNVSIIAFARRWHLLYYRIVLAAVHAVRLGAEYQSPSLSKSLMTDDRKPNNFSISVSPGVKLCICDMAAIDGSKRRLLWNIVRGVSVLQQARYSQRQSSRA
jgi:import inner membrane translocase subunit TIM23